MGEEKNWENWAHETMGNYAQRTITQWAELTAVITMDGFYCGSTCANESIEVLYFLFWK